MALTGLDIYKLLPRTNCKDCGFATCLAFAMALSQKKAPLGKCPHLSAQAKEALESASQPPIKLVTIGSGEGSIEIGNETVMYRHEQKFVHPAAIAALIEDTIGDAELDAHLMKIGALQFERAGQGIGVGLICIKNTSGYQNKLLRVVRRVESTSKLPFAIWGSEIEAMAEALKISKGRRPLVICATSASLDGFIALAKEHGLPLGVTASSLDEAAEAAGRAKAAGVDEIVINFSAPGLVRRIRDLTYARRAALIRNFRPLGYPVVAFTESPDADLELAEAVTYVDKYAGIVVVRNTGREFIFPLLVARQDIYQDPQKPVQVEPGIYEIGKVTKESPVLVTTNFSITYFTVAGEVESSKVPAYILCADAEGMSVLTAWAAEKFTAEKISRALAESGIGNSIGHRTVVIPGYVAVLSGKLEEVSGWKVSVGPKEASGIKAFLRNWKP